MYYLQLLRDSEMALKGAQQLDAVRSLTEEFGNLQFAWRWGVESRAFELLMSTLPALWLLYDMRGWLNAGLEQTDSLIQALRPQTDKKELKVALGLTLAFHGMFCFRVGDYARAKALLEESLGVLRPLNIPRVLTPALIFNGIVTSLMGNVSQAQAYMNEGVSIARETGDTWFLALGQFNQGFQLGLAGDRQRAYELMQAGLQLWREMGNARFAGMALNFLSPIAVELNLHSEARAYLEESLRNTSVLKDRWGMGTALGQLGSLNLLEGNLTEAEAQLEQSIAIFTELGARWDLAWAVMQLGKLQLHQSDFESAYEFLRRSIRIGLETNATPLVHEAAVELADCLLNLDRMIDASAIMQSLPDSVLNVESVRVRAAEVRSDVFGSGELVGGEMKIEDVLAGLVRE